MKWLLTVLIGLNLMVFLLAFFSNPVDRSPQEFVPAEANVNTINLLSITQDLPGDCFILGPIAQEITLSYFKAQLDENEIAYRVITDQQRSIQAYRVFIGPLEENELRAMRLRLEQAGVNDIYEKSSQSGEIFLSLGVFSYQKTATQFSKGLVKNNFPAAVQQEYLSFATRYWLNLDHPLENELLTKFNAYLGSPLLSQQTYPCR